MNLKKIYSIYRFEHYTIAYRKKRWRLYDGIEIASFKTFKELRKGIKYLQSLAI